MVNIESTRHILTVNTLHYVSENPPQSVEPIVNNSVLNIGLLILEDEKDSGRINLSIINFPDPGQNSVFIIPI